MDKILFLKPTLKERIWGSDYFYNNKITDDNSKKYGELWSLSAHSEGDCIITNGSFKGMTLSSVFNNNKDLFGDSKVMPFPIMIKLISTSSELSVQVHPDDKYALKNENDYGKVESWLILDCSNDSKIVYGHNAKNVDELKDMIEKDEYDKLLKYHNVKEGMFIKVPSGTIHALGKDIILLEFQQSSNVTYRFYDYHRVDKNGKERELHVDKAIDVTNYDSISDLDQTNYLDIKGSEVLWDNNYFGVEIINVNEEFKLTNSDKWYYVYTVAKGKFELDGKELNVGDSFIVTSLLDEAILYGNGMICKMWSKE